MSSILPKEFIIFDTEYTTWEGAMERGWNGENEFKEIVQIGAIRVVDLKEVDTLLIYVKPIKNPELSDYFKLLTKITQAEVDTKGVSLTQAFKQLSNWAENTPLYSYGHDGVVMKSNADLINTPFLFQSDQFNDVRNIFIEAGVDTSKYMSGTIPKAFGLIPPPDSHDALNDARSILMALQEVYKEVLYPFSYCSERK